MEKVLKKHEEKVLAKATKTARKRPASIHKAAPKPKPVDTSTTSRSSKPRWAVKMKHAVKAARSGCIDRSRSCRYWLKTSRCDKQYHVLGKRQYLRDACPASCNHCAKAKPSKVIQGCYDKSRSCRAWAKSHTCSKAYKIKGRQQYLEVVCPAACGVCKGRGAPRRAREAPRRAPRCADKSRSCGAWTQQHSCWHTFKVLGRKQQLGTACPKSCGRCH